MKIKCLKCCVAALMVLMISLPVSAKGIKTPYLTKRTKIVKKDVSFSDLKPVLDGKFALSEENSSLGYGSYYGMWTINGRRICNPIWETSYNSTPVWYNGACVVKDAATSQYAILYDNGKVKRFDESVSAISQFADGVATVEAYEGYSRVSYYINTDGEKIYPHLAESNLSYGDWTAARRLKCERRAFYSSSKNAWGFLDKDGNVVIEPQFRGVRDFANGYALVLLNDGDWDGSIAFIDASGKVVCNVGDRRCSRIDNAKFITDVSENGIYALSDDYSDVTKYYTLPSNEEKFSTYWGMGFYGGYAFMIPADAEDNHPEVYDVNFNKVGVSDFIHRGYSDPVFSPYGLLTINKMVVNPQGKAILQSLPAGFISDFSEDGYASFSGYMDVEVKIIERVKIKGDSFLESETIDEVVDREIVEVYLCGYCLPSGEIVVAFCKDFPSNVVHVTVIEEEEIDELEEEEEEDEEEVEEDPDPVPAKVVHKVKVKLNKPKAGTVSVVNGNTNDSVENGNTDDSVEDIEIEVEDGDTIKVIPHINEPEWKYVDETASDGIDKIKQGGYCVRNSGEICVRAIRPPVIDPPVTASYLGSMTLTQADGTVENVPIWLELNMEKALESPYGTRTCGFLAVAYNPDKRMHVTSGTYINKESFFNIFMAPMKVVGVEIDSTTNKQYLILDGGKIQYGNIKLVNNTSPSSYTNTIKNDLTDFLMMFNGFKDWSLSPAVYRLEIAEGKLGDESFTFGQLERFSIDQLDWLPSGDASFREHTDGLFVSTTTHGFSSNYLSCKVMRKHAVRPQIWWYPTMEFFGIPDRTMYEKIVRIMGEIYRIYESELDRLIQQINQIL